MSYFPKLAKRQAEAEEKNKKLVTSLNRRIFRGFVKTKKLTELKENENNPSTQMTTEQNKWDKYNPMPYEDNYNILYREKFLNKLKGKQINSIEILNSKKENTNNNNKIKLKKNIINDFNNNNIFLTYNNYNINPKKSVNNILKNPQLKIIEEENKKEENENKIIKKIFPDEEELKVISNIPFISLYKNPLRTLSVESKKHYSKKEKKILDEEYLYRISHKNIEDKSNNINKGIVRGFRTAYNEFGDKINSIHKAPKKLELNVENIFSNEKISQLSPVERHLQRIENNLNLIRTLPNDMFNDFANDFMNNDDFENEDFESKYLLKKNDKKEKENEKIITFDSAVFEEKKNKLLNKKLAQTSKNYYNPNSIPKIHIGDYLSKQLKNKAERFEIIHKIAFEDYIKKKNANLHEPKILKKNSIQINPDSHLLIKKKHTNKDLYEIESKTRDILIANKLKNDYSPKDIHRILNGCSPWNEENS